MAKVKRLLLKIYLFFSYQFKLFLEAIREGIREGFLASIVLIVVVFTITGVVYLIVILVRSVSTVVQLVALEYKNLFPVWKMEFLRFSKKCIFIFEDLTQFYLNKIVFPLGNFFQIVLNSNFFWYIVLVLSVLVGTIAAIFLFRRILFVFQKMKNHSKKENGGNLAEDFLVIVAGMGTIFPFGFVSKRVFFYTLNFCEKVFHQMMRDRMGAGLLCGFLGTAKGAFFPYLLLVPRLFFDNYEDSFWFEHHQRRVGAISSFVVGQFFHFLFFYRNSQFESLFQAHYVVVIFSAFFIFQVVWTHETIVKNWKYLHQNDKRKKIRKRILFLQLEFVANFFLQLFPTELDLELQEPKSMFFMLFQRYTGDNIFVRASFVGCVLGHIVFIPVWLKVFELFMKWVYPELKKIFEGGGGDRKRGGWDLFRYD